MKLILQCLRWIASPQTEHLDPNILDLSVLNWAEMLRIGRNQRVLGFVAFVLEKNGAFSSMDPKVCAALTKTLMQSEWHNHHKLSQFKKIALDLSHHNIPVIPLKGIDLSLRVYEKMSFREMADIDILIRESDLTAVEQLLLGEGFGLRKYPTKNRWHDQIHFAPHKLLKENPGGRASFEKDGLDIDLHWRLNYPIGGHVIEMNLEEAWANSKPYPAFGENVRVFSDEDAAGHLALHTAEMYNPSLIQLLDLALVMNLLGNTAVEKILSQFPEPAAASRKKIKVLLEDVQNTFKNDRTTERLIQFFIFEKTSEIYQKERVPKTDLSRQLRSPIDRIRYTAGYFLPNPAYYAGKKSGLAMYLMHWKNLWLNLIKPVGNKFTTIFADLKKKLPLGLKRSLFRIRIAAHYYLKKKKLEKPVFILCHERTGSNLLINYLNSHPAASFADEVLSTAQTYGLGKCFTSKKDVFRHLRYTLNNCNATVCGLKIFFGHLRRLKISFQELSREFPEVKWIVLYRLNTLNQFVSYLTATKTGVWLQSNDCDEIPRPVAIKLLPDQALAYHNGIKADLSHAAQCLNKKRKCLWLSYEEFSLDPQKTFDSKIFDFLELPKRRVSSNLVKQSLLPLQEQIENYEEVEAFIRNTDFTQVYGEGF